MAQIKKKAVREAILAAAKDLFTAKGYSGTTLSDIASESRVTMSNIYNYFPSKLGILYALYEPWLDHRLDLLGAEVARIRDPRRRLRKILVSVLRDIPSANNCFANNILQALSTLSVDEPYSRELLLRSERKVASMIREALSDCPDMDVPEQALAHLLFMAFDGFAVNFRVTGITKQADDVVDMLCDLMIGKSTSPAVSQATKATPTAKRASPAAAGRRKAAAA